jgi:putative transposase
MEPRAGARCSAAANQRWSLDFIEDPLASGRKFRKANLKDDCTRECPAIEIDLSLRALRVVAMLERAGAERGFPEMLVVDSGPELRGQALEEWHGNAA